MLTTGATYANDFARPAGELGPGTPLTCYGIQRGDTAALLARRLTGDAHNRRQPWFQILDPATATFVSKARYGAIQAGWHVCMPPAMVSRASVRPLYYLAPPAVPAAVQTSVVRTAPIDLTVLWWAVPLLVIPGLGLTWLAGRRYADGRRATVDSMRAFGVRFVSEFERPLFHRSAGDRPLRSRLRFAPARRRLEILLSPGEGRTYPNLVDHRRNVEYDVDRVQQVLSDELFVNGSLHAEGPWVVIPFRFETDRQQEGAP
jgi:hypothetical protein